MELADVTPLAVDSPEAMRAHAERLSTALHIDNDWKDRQQALQTLLQISVGVGDAKNAAAISFQPIVCELLMEPVRQQLTDLRSAIVKDSCRVLAAMSRALGDAFAPIAQHCLASLLALSFVTIKVMSWSSDYAVTAILEHTSGVHFLAELLRGLTDKHKQVRARCAEYLTAVLAQTALPGGDVPAVAAALAAALRDEAKEAREAAKQLYWAFHARHGDAAARVFDALTPTMQREVSKAEGSAGDKKNSGKAGKAKKKKKKKGKNKRKRTPAEKLEKAALRASKAADKAFGEVADVVAREQFDDLYFVFQLIDTDGSGQLSRCEAMFFLKNLGFDDITEESVDAFIGHFDEDGDSEISFAEFVHGCAAHGHLPRMSRVAAIRREFEAFDFDGNGVIDHVEVGLFFGCNFPSLTQDEIDARIKLFFKQVDVDGDGEVSWPEFLRYALAHFETLKASDQTWFAWGTTLADSALQYGKTMLRKILGTWW